MMIDVKVTKAEIRRTLSLTKLEADELAHRIQHLTSLVLDLKSQVSKQLDVTVHPDIASVGEKLVILHHTAEAHEHFLRPVQGEIQKLNHRLLMLEHPPKKRARKKHA